MSGADQMPLLDMLQVLSRTPVSQPQVRAVIAVTCGRWCAARGEDTEALRLLAHALELVPDLRPAMRLLYRIYLRRGDVRNAVRYLDQEIRATRHPREAAALYRERGKLVETHFGDRGAALQCYRAALKATPRDLAVLRSVETVALVTGDIFELIGNLEAQLEVLHDPAAVAAVLRDLALLEARRGGDLTLGAEMLTTALEEQPGNISLTRDLYQITEGSDDLAMRLLAEELDAEAHDGPARALPLWRASEVLEEARERPAAVALLRAAAHSQPSSVTLWRELEILSMKAARYDVAVEACVGQIKAIGEHDNSTRAELFYRIGKLAMGRLGRVTEGLAAMRKAVRLNPEHMPALEDASGYLVANEAWSQLLMLYELQVTTAEAAGLSHETRAQALLRAGQVMEEKLGELDGARKLYDRAVGACPTYRPALDRLERTLHQLGKLEPLRELYAAEIERAGQGPRRLFLLSLLGQLHARDDDPSAAIKVLVTLLKELPEHLPSLQLLARLLARAGRSKELGQVTEQEVKLTVSAGRRAKLLHRMAELALELGARDKAYVHLQDALAAVPDHRESVALLERMLREDGDHTQLLELLRRRVEHASDREARIALHLEIAAILANELGDREAAHAELGRLLKSYPGHLPALHFAERLAVELGRPRLHVQLLQKHLETVRSPRTRAVLLYQIALVQSGELDDNAGAIRSLRRALDLSPQLGVLRTLLFNLTREGDAHEDLFFEASHEALAWERGPADRRAAALELAERTASPEVALHYLQAAVSATPEDITTQRRVARAAMAATRPAIARAALEAAADRLARRGGEGDKRRAPPLDPSVLDLRVRAAWAAELDGDRSGADAGYAAVLELDPRNDLSQRARERLAAQRSRGPVDKLVARLIKAAADARPPADKAALLTRAAELQAQAEQRSDARETIAKAVAACPAYLPAHHVRVRLLEPLTSAGEVEEAIAAHEALAERCQIVEHKIEALCRAGQLALSRDDVRDAAARAYALFEKALSLDPSSRLAFHGIWQTCARFGKDGAPPLETSLLRRVEALDHAGTLNGRALRAMARVARECEGPACAVEILQHGLAVAAKNSRSQVGDAVVGDPAVATELASVLVELERFAEAAEQFARALSLADDPERRGALEHFLAEALERGGQHRAAIDHYIRASRLGYHTLHSLRAADRLAAAHGEVDHRVETLHLLLAHGDEEERARSLHTLASLHRERLGQPDDAMRYLADYLELRPEDTGRTRELARQLARAGKHARARATLISGLAALRIKLRALVAEEHEPGDRHKQTAAAVAGVAALMRALDRATGEYVATAILEVLDPARVDKARGSAALMPEPWPLPTLADESSPIIPQSGLPARVAFTLLREGAASLHKIPGAPPPPVKLVIRRSLPPGSKVASVVKALARILGIAVPPVYLNPKSEDKVIAHIGEGPALLVGRKINSDPLDASARDQIGRALFRLSTGGDHLHHRMSEAQITGLLYGLADGVGVSFTRGEHDVEVATQVVENLADSAASIDFGEAAEAFARVTGEFSVAALLQTLRALEVRSGAICAGDPRPTLEHLELEAQRGAPRVTELVSFLLSDEHLWIRKTLGYAVAEELDISEVEEVSS